MAPKTSSTPDVTKRVNEKIKPASELEGWQRFLFYGPSGAGKTRLSASAPNVLLIDVNELGTASVRKDYNPDVYPIQYWSEFNDVYWYLKAGNHKYESWAIDGITAMQNLCMKFVLGDERSRDASRDPDMPSRAVWGKVGELMKTQITNFRNLPMNGVFTALVRSRQGGDGDDELAEMTYGPACSPSIAGHLEAAVDTIGHLSVIRVQKKDKKTQRTTTVVRRRLITGPTDRFLTKDRNNAFGAYIDNPTVTRMLDLINDSDEEED